MHQVLQLPRESGASFVARFEEASRNVVLVDPSFDVEKRYELFEHGLNDTYFEKVHSDLLPTGSIGRMTNAYEKLQGLYALTKGISRNATSEKSFAALINRTSVNAVSS